MKYLPDTHRRRSIRLKGYDYSSAGYYFITICTQDRECLFGTVVDPVFHVGAGPCACPALMPAQPNDWTTTPYMRQNAAGRMVQTVWNELADHYGGIETDTHILMPNHFHGIIAVKAKVALSRIGVSNRLSLTDVIHRFKSLTTKRYADGVKTGGWKPFPGRLWQRNYWEHIIRGEIELRQIREYILNNPAQWRHDNLFVPSAAQ